VVTFMTEVVTSVAEVVKFATEVVTFVAEVVKLATEVVTFMTKVVTSVAEVVKVAPEVGTPASEVVKLVIEKGKSGAKKLLVFLHRFKWLRGYYGNEIQFLFLLLFRLAVFFPWFIIHQRNAGIVLSGFVSAFSKIK